MSTHLLNIRQQAAASEMMQAAGRATSQVNTAFSAFDYPPGKLDGARSFLMDDYLQSGRMARAHEVPRNNKSDHCWDVMYYQQNIKPFEPRQGFSETKFHAGFMRRQASQMPYLQQRVRRESATRARASCILMLATRPPKNVGP